ncbi:hypothetical protein P4377_24400 [Bacillus thuringiensis]|nr:hypothetical protein [Bacillus thuringiensis]
MFSNGVNKLYGCSKTKRWAWPLAAQIGMSGFIEFTAFHEVEAEELLLTSIVTGYGNLVIEAGTVPWNIPIS